MLEIKGLSVSYNARETLGPIDLNLPRGSSLAIIGESGAGKTTLALSIMGLCRGECKGKILWKEQDILAMGHEEKRSLRGNEISMVFQNVSMALHPLFTIEEQVIEAIMVHGPCKKKTPLPWHLNPYQRSGLTETKPINIPTS